MSLGDWTKYRDGGSLSSDPRGLIYTDILSPMFGTGSAVLTHEPTDEFQSINLVPATSPTGYVAGRMRTLIRLDDFDDSGVPNFEENHAGLLCMQSTENMAQFGNFGGTGLSYGVSVTIAEGFSAQSIRLWKFSAGLDGSSGSLPFGDILTSVLPPFVLSQGQTIALELTWKAEPLTLLDLGGVYLRAKIGQTTDFSDLQTVITYIDAASPYTATVAESIWAGFKNVVNTSANRVTFDQTSLFRTVVT